MAEIGEVTETVGLPPKHTSAPLGRLSKRILSLALLCVVLIAGVCYLSKNAPPTAARLLPESDAILYVDVAPLRAATRFHLQPVKHDADYQRFIEATGIEFERDLSAAAFAMHRMADPLGPNGPVAFSSIFVGHFDRQRLSSYLEASAQSRERYGGHDVYSIPVEGRTDRVTILGSDMVAVSNAPTAEQIHSILDRDRTAFLPFSSNSLLAQRYREVPVFSLAWGVGKLAVGLGDDFRIFGFRVPLSVDATFIASLRWVGSLRLKIEEIAPTDAAAALSADSLQAVVGLFKTAETALPDAVMNADTRALVNSVQIQHHSERAVVTAVIPLALVQELTKSPTTPTGQP